MNNQKESNLFLALLPIISLILMALASAVKWKFGMNVPLICSIIISCFVGKYIGISWNNMEKGLIRDASRAMPAVFILIIMGTIIGLFIASGIIPTLTYYGLTMITPRLFIPSAALVTAIIATATGTSFNSIATIGLALMVVGTTMGFPPHIVAGAVLSGAYFGDKISPLSDTTTVASSMSGCNIFEHVFHMMISALIALFISIVIYYFIGINFISGVNTNWSTIEQLSNGLSANFNINPILILVPLLSIIFALKKIPAIPSLLLTSIISGIFAMIFQGIHITKLFKIATFGYESNTGIKMLDSLLSRGGINSMGGTIILIIIASALGGILEEIGSLKTILNAIKKVIHSDRGIIISSMFSGLFISFATGAQILAIMIPARMFSKVFEERGIHAKNLSRIVESVGTVGIILVPWSVHAIFASNILGVEPFKFIPFVFFAFIDIFINIVMAYTGIGIAKIDTMNKLYEQEKISTEAM
ncbi:Na+/H+ antiporter NhaC [Clostridium tetani]|uniref:Na+/H+ antiporter NhaC n=1 Tax=Clostridium tetani TaxID=1513 RepID=A0A4Q0VFT2_CLOTA|nr:Na+/H+ antiporter NhaC [Clostridium tetani]RXI50491.1 Na+/H+ antiporter NhaC [Clostridium tetani]